jgi:hypothetical protein
VDKSVAAWAVEYDRFQTATNQPERLEVGLLLLKVAAVGRLTDRQLHLSITKEFEGFKTGELTGEGNIHEAYI